MIFILLHAQLDVFFFTLNVGSHKLKAQRGWKNTPLAPWDIPGWDQVDEKKYLHKDDEADNFPHARPNSPLGLSVRFSGMFSHY
jgi:hypothetical protein